MGQFLVVDDIVNGETKERSPVTRRTVDLENNIHRNQVPTGGWPVHIN